MLLKKQTNNKQNKKTNKQTNKQINNQYSMDQNSQLQSLLFFDLQEH